ncbi:VOC family protein [Streptomyces collinus]|uniref:VOC family protein n=1 Tax=Streptomyces collinus TaxID=42684 RepID=UPI003EBA6869
MLTGIVIDALDVERMNRFWLAATRGRTGGLRLRFGATRVDIGQGDVAWDVLADPEGNEFCVLRPGHPGVLAGSGLVAICLDVTEQDRSAQSAFWQSQADWRAVESHDWGVRLRRTPASTVSLVMGPPAAPKEARNRLRLEVTQSSGETVEFIDPGGNEFHVTG